MTTTPESAKALRDVLNELRDVYRRTGNDSAVYEVDQRLDALTQPEGPVAAPQADGRDNLLRFVAEVMDEWNMGDLDGGTRQDLAEKHGLLQPVEVTEPCGEGCECAAYGDFPQTCYRPTPLLREANAAMQATGAEQEVGR